MVLNRKIRFLQFAAAMSGSITTTGLASMLAWSSPALPYLTSKNSKMFLSKAESFWVVPLFNISCTLGYILNPLIIDNFGPKRTLLIYGIPQIISWLLIILAKNYVTIYLGMLLGGIAYGAGSCAMVVYLSEIGNKENRGIFLILTKLSLCIGHFCTMFLGAYVSYNSMNIGLLMLPLIFICTFLLMPDSSYFKQKNNDCEEEMKLNHGNEIKINLVNEKKITSLKLPEGEKVKELKENKLKEIKLWDLFILPNNRRALIIMMLLMAQNAFSGNLIMRSFAQKILKYEGSVLKPEEAAFLLSGLSIISSLISTVTVKKFGRRTLLVFFGIFSSLSQGIVGLFFFLKYWNFDVSSINWLPLFGIILYDFAMTNGTVNVSLIYQGELFPSDVKSVAITFSKVVFMIFVFTTAILFQSLINILDIFVLFWIFAASSSFFLFVIFKFAPETEGKSLEEIQVMLKLKRL